MPPIPLQGSGRQLAAKTGIRFVVEGEEPTPRLSPSVANVLYRIAQEALTNVMRHAQATTVTVTISAIGDTIRMVIADDGRGFDPAGRTSMERPSWGLLIMEERAHAIGATLRIESSPGSGTRVIVEVRR